MAFSDFSLANLKEQFHISVREDTNLFADTKPAPIPEALSRLLEDYIPLALAIDTGKARSEFIPTTMSASISTRSRRSSMRSTASTSMWVRSTGLRR